MTNTTIVKPNHLEIQEAMIQLLDKTINSIEMKITENVRKGHVIDIWVNDLQRIQKIKDEMIWFQSEY